MYNRTEHLKGISGKKEKKSSLSRKLKMPILREFHTISMWSQNRKDC